MTKQETNDNSCEVAVIGGGIVGLIMAIGLVRMNIRVKVYEQARNFREIGAGIAFTANAVRCMGLIDPRIPEALRSSGSVATSNGGEFMRWIDGYDRAPSHDGGAIPASQKLYYKLDAGHKGFEGCRRDQFLEALAKLLPPDVVELRKRLDMLTERSNDGRIVLNFVDGSVQEANAVIACDGIKSRVREILFGEGNPASYPHYTHKVAYRTLIPMDKAIEAVGHYQASNQHIHIGPNAHLVHYPVAKYAMINATAFVTDSNSWPDDKQQVTKGSFADVDEAFSGWAVGVRDLVNLFPRDLEKWAVFDTWDYPAPFYSRGNICLAGDAAHASSPHHGAGACMGIEDALCLCTVVELAHADAKNNAQSAIDAFAAAFQTFDGVRRTRSQWLVNSSRRVCDLYQQPEWADETKLVKAETCFEEIKDRSLKIWRFDYDGMVKDSVRGYEVRRKESNASLS